MTIASVPSVFGARSTANEFKPETFSGGDEKTCEETLRPILSNCCFKKAWRLFERHEWGVAFSDARRTLACSVMRRPDEVVQ